MIVPNQPEMMAFHSCRRFPDEFDYCDISAAFASLAVAFRALADIVSVKRPLMDI
jgi:hypothetical protein